MKQPPPSDVLLPMRPLDVVLAQLRFDRRFDVGGFVVGFVDRTHPGLREEPLPAFLARKDVPHHRVRRLRFQGRVVWDRDDGTDVVAACAVRDAVAVDAADVDVDRFAFWNLSDRKDTPDVVDAAVALAAGVDVAAFVECGAAVRDACAARGFAVFATAAGDVVVVVRAPNPARPPRATPLPLPGRDALVVDVGGVVVVAAHLTSSVHGDRSARRAEQRAALVRALPAHGPVVVLVDANDVSIDVDGEFAGFVDQDAGPTFSAAERSAKNDGDGTKQARRLDHVLCRGVDLDVVVDRGVVGSDHWPLLATRSASSAAAQLPMSSARATDPRTALAIVVAGAAADAVDDVRRAHDRAAARWPPHINLMFPFVRDDHTWASLAQVLTAVAPFAVTLGATVDVGRRSRAASIVDTPAFAALRAALAQAGVAVTALPHLTLTSDGSDADASGLVVDVDAVCVLVAGDDGVYRVVERLALGAASLQEALRETRLLDETTPRGHAPAAVAAALAALPGSVRLCGSSARGVRFVDSDVDVAWSPPADLLDPLATALALLGGTRTDAVAAPRIKTTIAGVDVDVVVGGDDAVRAADAPLSDAALWALRALRTWARVRGLKNANNNGMPSSIAWHGLVVDHAREGVDEEGIVAAVFDALADDDNVGAVSGTGFRGVTPHALAHLRAEARRAQALVGAWRTLLGGAASR
jgi:poly(A) polymerase